jgi:hypothetical protein
MDVVMIFNGLGNQMSQYAFYLRKKNINSSTKLIYDKGILNQHYGYELKRVFGIELNYGLLNLFLLLLFKLLVSNKYQLIVNPIVKSLNLSGVRLIKEPINYDFDESCLIYKKGINFYWGGWHTEKYFLPIKEEVINAFAFKSFPFENDSRIKETIMQIKQSNSVSIHIRRGDFLTSSGYYQFSGICTNEYYQKGIEYIKEKVDNPIFFVFSDDLEWCKKNLLLDSVIFVDCNNGENSWRDMYLMSLCKHNINANSTFSWWGAWLNKNIDKNIFVPEFFINEVETKDIYPENWIKITK